MQILKNKFFILGNLLVILVVLPLTLFFIKQQQENRGKAAPTTILSYSPANVSAKQGEAFDVDIMVNPAQNIVSIIDMDIRYDPSRLELITIAPNQTAFPQTLKGPVIATGSATISLNIGADVTKAIQTNTKVATLTFKPLAGAPGGQTQVSFFTSADPTKPTRVLSLAEPDGAGENVLASTAPATVTIAAAAISPTLTPTPTGVVTTPSPTGTEANQSPVCSSLSIDQATTGTAPYTLMFTANGNDADGTISKVSFDFGDGPVEDVTSAGGIGTATASVQKSHTYANPGTYQANVFFTDNTGGISSSTAACTATIVVNAGAGEATPIPTLAPTGSTATTLAIIGGVILTIIGGAVLLLL